MASSPISNLRIELGETALKEIVLQHHFTPEYGIKPEEYEAYFYLTETGSPVFVIEEKK